MFKHDNVKLYLNTADTAEYARGRTPEITPTFIPPVNHTNILGAMKTREKIEKKKKLREIEEENLAISVLAKSRMSPNRNHRYNQGSNTRSRAENLGPPTDNVLAAVDNSVSRRSGRSGRSGRSEQSQKSELE